MTYRSESQKPRIKIADQIFLASSYRMDRMEAEALEAERTADRLTSELEYLGEAYYVRNGDA